jgi:hypothetical protein
VIPSVRAAHRLSSAFHSGGWNEPRAGPRSLLIAARVVLWTVGFHEGDGPLDSTPTHARSAVTDAPDQLAGRGVPTICLGPVSDRLSADLY